MTPILIAHTLSCSDLYSDFDDLDEFDVFDNGLGLSYIGRVANGAMVKYFSCQMLKRPSAYQNLIYFKHILKTIFIFKSFWKKAPTLN